MDDGHSGEGCFFNLFYLLYLFRAGRFAFLGACSMSIIWQICMIWVSSLSHFYDFAQKALSCESYRKDEIFQICSFSSSFFSTDFFASNNHTSFHSSYSGVIFHFHDSERKGNADTLIKGVDQIARFLVPSNSSSTLVKNLRYPPAKTLIHKAPQEPSGR